ncbi:MAG TPA: hypothetical protein VGL91_13565 [Acidobacteriota bacterium]
MKRIWDMRGYEGDMKRIWGDMRGYEEGEKGMVGMGPRRTHVLSPLFLFHIPFISSFISPSYPLHIPFISSSYPLHIPSNPRSPFLTLNS